MVREASKRWNCINIWFNTGCVDVKVDPVSEETPEVTEDYDNIMDALVDIQEKGDNMMAGIW